MDISVCISFYKVCYTTTLAKYQKTYILKIWTIELKLLPILNISNKFDNIKQVIKYVP